LCQGDGCGVENNLGFLDEISLESKESPGWLILKTAVGINCKVDYSIIRRSAWETAQRPAVEIEFAQQCRTRPGVTQVAVSFLESETFYFLVKDLGAHRYRVLDASKQRQSGCPGEKRVDTSK